MDHQNTLFNRTSRYESIAREVNDILGEAGHNLETVTPEEFDRAVKVLDLRLHERIANSLETIAKSCDRRGYYD